MLIKSTKPNIECVCGWVSGWELDSIVAIFVGHGEARVCDVTFVHISLRP